MIMGSVVTAVGYTCLNFAHTYWHFAVVYFVVAIGFSLISGADIALIYESMDFLAPEKKRPHRIVATQQFLMVSAEAVAAIGGGLLAERSMALLVKVNTVFAWIPLFIAFTLKDPMIRKPHHNKRFQELKTFIHELLIRDHYARLTFMNWVFWSFLTYNAIWILQKNWQEHNISLSSFGYLWAICNLSVGVFGHAVEGIERTYGKKNVLLLIGLGPIIGYLGMSHSQVTVVTALGLLFYMSRGLFSVSLREIFNSRMSHQFRATGNSLQSFSMRLMFTIFSPLIGAVIDQKGSAYLGKILAGVSIVGFIFLLLPLIRTTENSARRNL
jgi:hypothetical protein